MLPLHAHTRRAEHGKTKSFQPTLQSSAGRCHLKPGSVTRTTRVTYRAVDADKSKLSRVSSSCDQRNSLHPQQRTASKTVHSPVQNKVSQQINFSENLLVFHALISLTKSFLSRMQILRLMASGLMKCWVRWNSMHHSQTMLFLTVLQMLQFCSYCCLISFLAPCIRKKFQNFSSQQYRIRHFKQATLQKLLYYLCFSLWISPPVKQRKI